MFLFDDPGRGADTLRLFCLWKKDSSDGNPPKAEKPARLVHTVIHKPTSIQRKITHASQQSIA